VRELEAVLVEGAVRELIVATNSTVEGEATGHYLSELAARRRERASCLAHGVPLGGVDGRTFAHALAGRRSV
jgi:recombination protein RecR